MSESKLYRQKFLELALPKDCPAQQAIRDKKPDMFVLLMPFACDHMPCETCLERNSQEPSKTGDEMRK